MSCRVSAFESRKRLTSEVMLDNSLDEPFEYEPGASVSSPLQYTFVNTPLSDSSSIRRGRPGKTRIDHVQDALHVLRKCRMGPVDLLMHVLDEGFPDNSRYRNALLDENGKLRDLLNLVKGTYEGRKRLEDWIRGPGSELVERVVEEEMDSVKRSLTTNLVDITPQYIDCWTLEGTVGSIAKTKALFLTGILMSAGQTRTAQEKNKLKRADAVCRRPPIHVRRNLT
jgi:hypothetical protein